MEIFNIGIGELLVIMLLMYLLLGPQGMLRAARWLGQMTQQAYRFFNETWRSITDVPMDIRDLPNALLKETGLKETYDELRQEGRAVQSELNRGLDGEEVGKPEEKPALPEPKISPPAQPGANGPAVPEHIAADAVLAGAAALTGSTEPAGGEEMQIRPAQQAVAADIRPAAEEAAEAAAIAAVAEPARPKRGRPRKGEVRPPPEPKIPRKRGRPPKNRPEATAAGPAAVAEPAAAVVAPEAAAADAVADGAAAKPAAAEASAGAVPVTTPPRPPVKKRAPGEGRLPRKAPSQPGDPIVPIDLEHTQGARAYASNPAPTADEENTDRNAA